MTAVGVLRSRLRCIRLASEIGTAGDYNSPRYRLATSLRAGIPVRFKRVNLRIYPRESALISGKKFFGARSVARLRLAMLGWRVRRPSPHKYSSSDAHYSFIIASMVD